MFAFSCKQVKGGETPLPAPSNDITITVKGDTACTISKLNEIKIKKSLNLTWKEIRLLASSIITLPKDKEIKEWRLTDAKGALLKDADKFEKDTVIWAVSQERTGEEDITITVRGDENCTIGKLKTIKIQKNLKLKWQDIKKSAEVIITLAKDKEIKEWRVSTKDGDLLKEETILEKDTTIFAVSKGVDATYTVEHWQENIEDDNFTKVEDATETLTGESGKNTEAASKEYPDYTAQQIIQQTITADGKTVVKIKYKRNTVSLIINLEGGTTKTKLEDGKGEHAGKKLLIGKVGATVKMENPTKENFGFYKWVPELPNIFMKDNDKKEYVADWRAALRINIVEGDDRLEIKEKQIILPYDGPKKWKDIKIKKEITDNVKLKDDWKGGDYEIYDWRAGNEKGKEITDETDVEDVMTVYPRSNYAKFKWGFRWDSEENHIKGYDGEKPRGKIIIPTKTTAIKSSAFRDCAELTAVNFTGCSELTSIDLSGTGIKNIDLSPCTKLTSIDFYNCTNLESVNLTGCSKLTSIGLSGTGIKNIDLSPCTKLTSIDFYNCTNLESVNLTGCSELIYINLSDTGIKNIDLSPCTKLTSIYFSNCTNLESVNLTGCSALTEINHDAFSGCVALKELNLTGCSALKEINNNTFKDCVALKELNLTGCSELTSIDLSGTGIKNIDLSPCTKLMGIDFYNCTNLESVNLTGCIALTKIDYNAFKGCVALKEVNLTGCSELIYINLSGTGIKNIDLSPCTKLMGIDFYNCTNLESVNLTGCSALTEINHDAFSGCVALKELNLTGCSELKKLGTQHSDGIFEDCKALEKVNLTGCSALTEINHDAFSGCVALKEVNLTGCSELTSINLGGTGIKNIDLSPCTKLTRIYFSNCTNLESVNLTGCSELEKLKIGLDDEVFKNCKALEKVNLTGCSALTEINHDAFSGCVALKEVNLTGCSALTKIDYNTFKDFVVLKEVNLTGCSALTKINYDAFEGCVVLKEVNLTGCSALTGIGSNAFSGCIEAVVKLPASITKIEWRAFGNEQSNYCKEVHVPNETIKGLVKNAYYPEGRIKMY